MLTPQEVSERAFQKVNFGGGYNMNQVDEFLDVLTQDYTSLYNDNALLKNKMKVLLDKVEEYRSTEEAMRRALLSAQRMADELVQQAKNEKESILRETEEKARQRRMELEKELDAEAYRLKTAQQATAAFVEQVAALQGQQRELLSRLKELYPPEVGTPPADRVEETASAIDDNVQRLLAKAMQSVQEDQGGEDAAQEEEREDEDEDEEEDAEPGSMDDTAEYIPASQLRDEGGESGEADGAASKSKRKIDYNKLQFGKDYEIR